MPDPQITQAKCADGMIITIQRRQPARQATYEGIRGVRVCYRAAVVVVVSFLSIENPEAALFQTGFGRSAV